MTDITKCNGKRKIEERIYTCPFRAKCWRHLAPSGRRQSWFSETPLQRDTQTGAPSCTEWLPTFREQPKPGSTVIPHPFETSEEGPFCRCGWPKENHL